MKPRSILDAVKNKPKKEKAPSPGEIVGDAPKRKARHKGPGKKPWSVKGRLPDGARFELSFQADPPMWTGKLTVGDQSFEREANGAFLVMHRLDEAFRDWAKKSGVDLPLP
jgi:hypothetical protein